MKKKADDKVQSLKLIAMFLCSLIHLIHGIKRYADLNIQKWELQDPKI